MKTASWVIVNKSTGKAVFETRQKSAADAVNPDRYMAVPIREWLAGLNKCGG